MSPPYRRTPGGKPKGADAAGPAPAAGVLPSRQQILDFIAGSPGQVGRREIARAFRVPGPARDALRELIAEVLRTRRSATRGKRPDKDFSRDKKPDAPRRDRKPAVSEVVIISVTGIAPDGTPEIEIAGGEDQVTTLPLRLVEPAGEAALGLGGRAVARLRRREDGGFDAVVLRRVAPHEEAILGIFHADGRDGGQILPTDRHSRHNGFRVRGEETMGALEGEFVIAAPLPLPRLGLPHAQIIERLGRPDDPRAISMIAIHSKGIPYLFPTGALTEAAQAQPAPLDRRTDLRGVPLVTIDGADARDFDDAVFAEPDGEGWHALVAIADVAWYVRPDSALDRTARERGNSVYFPDRVVPMLPEALSNDLCSLRPDEDRACMAIHLWIDRGGNLTRHRVERGLMRSRARLTYEQVQAAMDGAPDDATAPLLDSIIRPLYGAYAAFDRARAKRGTLDLDIPERRILLGADGGVASIGTRERLDSHKLIEEFMIAANVAAAETLERLGQPCMYRVHDVPDTERLENLAEALQGLGTEVPRLAKGQTVKPSSFNRILAAVAGRPEAPLINNLVLRSQAQAAYAPENIGHFGLALSRYAHFTSPIRRYSDLVVHRALIEGMQLGAGGLGPEGGSGLAELGLHLSATERRAAAAERHAVDRYMVAFLAERTGEHFHGRVSGVAKFGLFVTLIENGADGLVPTGSLPSDFYHYDADRHTLTGQRHRRKYTLGDQMEIQLAEADLETGKLRFRPVIDGAVPPERSFRPGKPMHPRSGRPPNVRLGRSKKKRK